MPYSIETPRLLLRPWQRNDFALFAQINASPEIMRYFPQPLSTIESNMLAEKFQHLIELKYAKKSGKTAAWEAKRAEGIAQVQGYLQIPNIAYAF